ncbi:hypothetical protein Thi970DRAFT_03097 [Thiorhodovibrio frisius]|uniref:Uncharacterized protein n=1 Tax=Thiorhodovibrio frisius TaxID=631362 RepID=H8Z5H2_9GAMM|nr:hypothetical protein Thi970DRAFT_03097 [Thiorhodovibrio frisius]WPL20519.1 hypothetical protein Thiofri_00617 [Thiorhodovibrio frisius]
MPARLLTPAGIARARLCRIPHPIPDLRLAIRGPVLIRATKVPTGIAAALAPGTEPAMALDTLVGINGRNLARESGKTNRQMSGMALTGLVVRVINSPRTIRPGLLPAVKIRLTGADPLGIQATGLRRTRPWVDIVFAKTPSLTLIRKRPPAPGVRTMVATDSATTRVLRRACPLGQSIRAIVFVRWSLKVAPRIHQRIPADAGRAMTLSPNPGPGRCPGFVKRHCAERQIHPQEWGCPTSVKLRFFLMRCWPCKRGLEGVRS